MKKSFRSISHLLLFSLLTLISGCGGCDNTSTPESVPSLKEFCLQVEEELNYGNFGFIDQHFDKDSLINIVTNGIDAPEYYEKGFKDNVLTESVGRMLHEQLGMKGYVKLLKHSQSTDRNGCFYRMVSAQKIDYLELYLKSEAMTRPIYDFFTFEQISSFGQNLRRYYTIYLAAEDSTFSHPSSNFIPTIQSIATLGDEGKFEEAQNLFDSMPESIRKEKLVLLLQLNLGRDIGTDALKIAIENYKSHYPDDALLEYKLMEFAYEKEDAAGQIEAVSKFQAAIGGDPYLEFMKGIIALDNKQLDQSEQYIRQAINEEPQNDEPYWVLIDLLVKQERYDEVIELFQNVQTEFEVNPAEYIIYDGYTDFYKSPQFQSWVLEYPMEDTLNVNIDSIEQLIDGLDEHHGHEH